MATHHFEIYFFGLICVHSKSPERIGDKMKKTRAMLLRDSAHTPLIYLNAAATVFELDRFSKVKFDNVDKGPATVLESFDRFIPHLAALTAGSVKLDLGADSIRVTLPAGRLATVNPYPYKGEFLLNNTKVQRLTDCIGRINLLDVTTESPYVSVKFKNGDQQYKEDVDSSGWVLLANMELDTGAAEAVTGRTRRADFGKHAKATDHDATSLATLFELDTDCHEPINNDDIEAKHLDEVIGIVQHYPRVFAHPECSNTNWP